MQYVCKAPFLTHVIVVKIHIREKRFTLHTCCINNYILNLSVVDGMCMLLRRLAYPNRLVDLEHAFGYSSTVLSNVINLVLQLIEDRKGHLLENLGNLVFFNRQKLQQYAQVCML